MLSNQKEEFVITLKDNTDTFLSDIDYDYAGSLYFIEFKYILDEKQTSLDRDDFIHGIKVMNVIVDINKTIDICCINVQNSFETYANDSNDLCFINNANELFNKLNNPNAHLQDVRDEPQFRKRYLNALILAKQLKNNNNNLNGLNDSEKLNSSSLSDSGHGESEILVCNLLTHGEILECISQCNADYEQECLG